MILHHFVQMIYFTINDAHLKAVGTIIAVDTDKKDRALRSCLMID